MNRNLDDFEAEKHDADNDNIANLEDAKLHKIDRRNIKHGKHDRNPMIGK